MDRAHHSSRINFLLTVKLGDSLSYGAVFCVTVRRSDCAGSSHSRHAFHIVLYKLQRYSTSIISSDKTSICSYCASALFLGVKLT